jgi:hypothetical protein
MMASLLQPIPSQGMDECYGWFFRGRCCGRHFVGRMKSRFLDFQVTQMIVAPVTERRVLGVLAHAQVAFLCFINRECKRLNSRASMRAVTEGLRIRVTAGAPIVLAFIQIDLYWLLRSDLR